MAEKTKPTASDDTLLERVVEGFLWNFRYIIVLAILGLLLGSIIAFLIGFFEVLHITGIVITEWMTYGWEAHIDEIYKDVLLGLIIAVDDFLLGIVLLIFGMGTYDLFISHIDPAERDAEIRPDWMVFTSLDELKSVLGKVVLMIMIITFLKHIVRVEEVVEKINLLFVAGSIALVALALKWSHEEHLGAHDIARSKMIDRIRMRQEKEMTEEE
jgi:uncharacterized membrane protein YqhA